MGRPWEDVGRRQRLELVFEEPRSHDGSRWTRSVVQSR